jgi:hypothetical protein
VHVGHVEARDLAASANIAVADCGSSVWTWILSVWASPTTSTESPIVSSGPTKRPASRPRPMTAKFVQ